MQNHTALAGLKAWVDESLASTIGDTLVGDFKCTAQPAEAESAVPLPIDY